MLQSDSSCADGSLARSQAHTTTEQTVVTHHKGIFNNQSIEYCASCASMVLREESEKEGHWEGEKPRATIFYTAYTKTGSANLEQRPIIFCFNGGPGSSSIWLHMTLFGPQRVLLDEQGAAGKPPHRLTPNEFCLLDVSDIVFIDPIGTGYSRMLEGEKVAQFHDIETDIQSVGEFIRLYCSRNKRWASPKFIAGESYGSTRACGLAHYLQTKHGMYLNGLILISCVLDFITLWVEPSDVNDLPFALFLPTMAATAWYHRKLPADLQKQSLQAVVAQAEAFAANEYTLALFKGRSLTGEARQRIVAQVARFTGVSEQFVERCDLRIDDSRYYTELLRDQGKTIGRLDSRFTGQDRDNAGELALTDPARSNLLGACATAFNHYMRETLAYVSDSPYTIMTSLYKTWGWGDYKNKYASVSDKLREAMQANPHLQVLIASGYFDLATPHFATDYTIDHLRIGAQLRNNIAVKYYEAGHMMYIHKPSLASLSEDLRAFIIRSQ